MAASRVDDMTDKAGMCNLLSTRTFACVPLFDPRCDWSDVGFIGPMTIALDDDRLISILRYQM